MLNHGADPSVSNDDEADRLIRVGGHDFMVGGKGTTAIIYAARQGKADCVKKLIEAGADVNNASQDNEREGNTPSMAAMVSRNAQCVRELIKAGADLNIPDKNGMTALMIASDYLDKGDFFQLIKTGAEVNLTFLADIARKLLMAADRAGIQYSLLQTIFIVTL